MALGMVMASVKEEDILDMAMGIATTVVVVPMEVKAVVLMEADKALVAAMVVKVMAVAKAMAEAKVMAEAMVEATVEAMVVAKAAATVEAMVEQVQAMAVEAMVVAKATVAIMVVAKVTAKEVAMEAKVVMVAKEHTGAKEDMGTMVVKEDKVATEEDKEATEEDRDEVVTTAKGLLDILTMLCSILSIFFHVYRL